MLWLENEDLQFELIWEPCIHVLSLVSQGLFSQLWTHHEVLEAQEEEDDDLVSDETPVTGFWSGFIWLAAMTVVISVLSEYVVGTTEEASATWGLSVSFIIIILLPIVRNATEHAGAVIFAFKNKLDIT